MTEITTIGTEYYLMITLINNDMRRFPLCFFTLCLFLFSCDKVTERISPSYVCQYNEFKKISASQIDNGAIVVGVNGFSMFYNIDSKGEEKRIFDSLCVKHNDLSYNKEIRYIMALPNQYLACDFTSINVTSDADFDDVHPMGSSLNDIFRFMSWSPYRYILDGYIYYEEEAKKVSDTFKDFYGEYWFDHEKEEGFKYPVDKMACDIDPDDMTLLGEISICVLKAESNPTISKQHNLTITLTADNGKTYSTTLFAEFE